MILKPFALQLSALAILLGGLIPAQAADIVCETPAQVDKLKKEKLLKSFTSDFWKIARKHIRSYPPELKREGIVVGDFHFENLGLFFDEKLNSPVLTLNDLDDSGVNYQIGDLLKYLIYLRTVDKDLDLSRVIEAYTLGLQGQTVKAPPELRDLLNLRSSDFDRKKYKYVQKRKEDFLASQTGNLSSSQRTTLEKLKTQPLFQNFSEIRGWMQIHDSGSSAGMERYLFLANSKTNSVEGVIEFKSLKCSATGPSDHQDLSANFRNMAQTLGQIPGLSGTQSFLKRQTVVDVDGKAYLVREKLPNLINQLEIEKMDLSDLQSYSEFYGSFLGLVHSGNSPEAYRQALLNRKSFILDELKPIYKELKEEIEKWN